MINNLLHDLTLRAVKNRDPLLMKVNKLEILKGYKEYKPVHKSIAREYKQLPRVRSVDKE